MQYSPDRAPHSNHALGAVLGALVGDAGGAVLEFFGRPIASSDVDHARSMPGGGTWRVAPGQITDDGELTMSLLRALAEDDSSASEIAVESAARRYARWVKSGPFDIGATTAASLGCLRDPSLAALADREGARSIMTKTAAMRCMQSKANGSLMRATPLAVWGATRDAEITVNAVMMDARLSHPNDACVGAAVAYVMAIRHLIVAPADVRGAMAIAEASTTQFAEAQQWIADAKNDVRVPYTPQDGFVRIAFTHAFRHLALGTSYADAIQETLAGGGDTDTNACIVGGLIGARFGVDAIPATMRKAVLDCDHSKGANPRPDDLHPRDVPALVLRLLLGSTRNARNSEMKA